MQTRAFGLGLVCFALAAAACAVDDHDEGSIAAEQRDDAVRGGEGKSDGGMPLKLIDKRVRIGGGGPVEKIGDGGLDPNESSIDITDGVATGTACWTEVCFSVKSTKELSFIAIDVGDCPGADVDLALYSLAGGARNKVDITPVPHGNGKSCEGIPADALKFEGLREQHYLICATGSGVDSLGAIKVYAKAGQTCAEGDLYNGGCEPCDTGTGGSGGSGQAGSGGSGQAGSGGSGQGGTGGTDGGAAGCAGDGGVTPCDEGQTRCGDACVDLGSDEHNCGGCGIKCGEGQTCTDGVCCGEVTACPEGQTRCGDACVDTRTDPHNCGGCDIHCGDGHTCIDGACCEVPLTPGHLAPPGWKSKG